MSKIRMSFVNWLWIVLFSAFVASVVTWGVGSCIGVVGCVADNTGIDAPKQEEAKSEVPVQTGDYSPVVVVSVAGTGVYVLGSILALLVGYQRWRAQHGLVRRLATVLELAPKNLREGVAKMGGPLGDPDIHEIALQAHLRRMKGDG